MEVIPVFDLRTIRVAELVIQRLLLQKRVIVGHVERDMMRCAFSEDPAARRPFWLVMENNGSARATIGDFQPMIFSFGPSLVEPFDGLASKSSPAGCEKRMNFWPNRSSIPEFSTLCRFK